MQRLRYILGKQFTGYAIRWAVGKKMVITSNSQLFYISN